MKILLTGANGFIGRYLVPLLLARGHNLVLPLRSSSELKGLIPNDYKDKVMTHHAPEFGCIDFLKLTNGIDAVVHLAGIAHPSSKYSNKVFDKINRRLTIDIAKAAQINKVGRFIFISSIRAQIGPSAETIISEKDTPIPVDDYGRSKLAAETDLAKIDNLPSVSLRPVVVYGPNAKGNIGLLQKLIKWGIPLPIKSISAKRSYLSIDLLADAIIYSLERSEPLTGSYIVADPEPLSLVELSQLLHKQLKNQSIEFKKGMKIKNLRIFSFNEIVIKFFMRLFAPQLWQRCGESQLVSTQHLKKTGWQGVID